MTFVSLYTVHCTHVGGDPVSMVVLGDYWTFSFLPIRIRDELSGTALGNWLVVATAVGTIDH